jgi:hypothetical protein
MRAIRLPAIIGFCLLGLAACEDAVNRGSAELLKYSLREACGEQDPACIEAVNSQFDACHARYAGEWSAYLNGSFRDEDALLGEYLRKIYGCLVDADGEPLFFFEPS